MGIDEGHYVFVPCRNQPARPRRIGWRERAIENLHWFYVEAEGALGLRATPYERSGHGATDTWAIHEAADHRIGDVLRWRRASNALEELEPQDVRLLRLAFTPRRWEGLEALGELAAACCVLVLEEPPPARRETRSVWRDRPSCAGIASALRLDTCALSGLQRPQGVPCEPVDGVLELVDEPGVLEPCDDQGAVWKPWHTVRDQGRPIQFVEEARVVLAGLARSKDPAVRRRLVAIRAAAEDRYTGALKSFAKASGLLRPRFRSSSP